MWLFGGERLRLEALQLRIFVVFFEGVESASALLQLVEAPLDLREVLLRVGSQDADSSDHLSNRDLLKELVEASFKHSFSSLLDAAADATLGW